MPFANSIAGGNGGLVRNWIQSQNFVTGVSGWRISKNGNAEFNNGTFRGSINVGTPGGQQFIVNNTVTGDVIDVYDFLGRLILKIDNQGNIVSIAQPSTSTVTINNASVNFAAISSPPTNSAYVAASSISPSSTLVINSGNGLPASLQTAIQLYDTQAGGGVDWIKATQRNTSGGIVSTANGVPGNNLVHMAVYSTTLTAASTGNWLVSHNAGFTPVGAILVVDEGPSTGVGQLCNLHAISSTLLQATVYYVNTGTGLTNYGTAGDTVQMHVILFG